MKSSTLQPAQLLSQKSSTFNRPKNPSQAALFLSLESVFGVLFSVLLYGEVMTSRLLVGFALIFVAILVNEVVAPRVEAKRAIVAFGRDKWKEDGPHD